MTLIKSISGIRGTIGGPATENLTPLDIVKFTTAYVRFIAESAPGKRLKIVVGRDARISGEMVGDIIKCLFFSFFHDIGLVCLCQFLIIFIQAFNKIKPFACLDHRRRLSIIKIKRNLLDLFGQFIPGHRSLYGRKFIIVICHRCKIISTL